MVESTGEPTTPPMSAAAAAPAAGSVPEATRTQLPRELSVHALLDAGAHFGHQTRRWDPRMKPYIYGERHGIHILNLDLTARRLRAALDFVRETVARGGKVLFVGTKRQAQAPIRLEAEHCSQFYVNNRWLGGMLTNFRTVKKSIERYKQQLELLADEEKVGELSKKELSRVNRSVTKYQKSLDGIQDMSRLPDLLFIVDVNREHIALSEAQRLGIPILAIVDTNCNPEGIDYVVPANDDAIRAIQYYCALVADACLEGVELHQERIQAEATAPAAKVEEAPTTGRRVVEIKQPPRGGRRGGARGVGGRRGRERPEAAEAPTAGGEPASSPEAAAPDAPAPHES